jgi:hypothetical protein
MGVVPGVVPVTAGYMFIRGCAAPANMFTGSIGARPHCCRFNALYLTAWGYPALVQ